MSAAKGSSARRSASTRPWWAGPIAALGWGAASAAASAPAALLALTFGTSAWTGCWAGECDASPNAVTGTLWYLLLAVVVVTPLLVLISAWRAWAGWWLVGLGLSVAHLATWAAILGYI